MPGCSHFHHCNGVNGFALDFYSDSRAIDVSVFGSEAFKMNRGMYSDKTKTTTKALSTHRAPAPAGKGLRWG